MDMRHEGWTLGSVGPRVIDAEPVRTVYTVRDEQVVPLDQRQSEAGEGTPRGVLAQGALEVGNAFAGLGFGVFRFVVALAFGSGFVGVLFMGLYWLMTQHPNSVRYGLASLALMFVAAVVQVVGYGLQQRLNAWVSKGSRRAG